MAQGERVLIVDWDVHHGNGTQDIFWDDPRCSTSRRISGRRIRVPARASETGGRGAPGLTINFPLPPGATGDVALAALDDVVAPAVDRFGPTWVLISAGFDAAPRRSAWPSCSGARATTGAHATRVAAFAPVPGRVVAFLEGGYDLDALRASVAASVAAWAGESCATEPPTAGGPGRDVLEQTLLNLERAATG